MSENPIPPVDQLSEVPKLAGESRTSSDLGTQGVKPTLSRQESNPSSPEPRDAIQATAEIPDRDQPNRPRRADLDEHGGERLIRDHPNYLIVKDQNGRLLPDGTVEVPLAIKSSKGTAKPNVLEWRVNNDAFPANDMLRVSLPIGKHTVTARVEGSRFPVRATVVVQKESIRSDRGDFTVLPF